MQKAIGTNGVINLLKLAENKEVQLNLSNQDKDESWVIKLFDEINENSPLNSTELKGQDYYLHIDLKLTRKFSNEFDDHLVLSTKIKARYKTLCIKSLEPMDDELDISYNVIVLKSSFENDENFSEDTEIYYANSMHELFYYEKNEVNLFEIIHELIYLDLNQYPTKSNN